MFRHYITAALLLLYLDSTLCSDNTDTVADVLGWVAVRRLVGYLTEEECSHFFRRLSGQSKKSKEMPMEECQMSIKKWYEDKANTTDLDRLYYAFIYIKRVDFANAVMDELYQKVLKNFDKPMGNLNRISGGSSRENNGDEDEDELIILRKELPPDQSVSLSLIFSIWFLSLVVIPLIALIVGALCTCCALRVIDDLDN